MENIETTQGNSVENLKQDLKSPKIEINDLVKIYKTGEIEVVALRGLTASFYPNEIVMIEGPSGCGKTTLINILGGLDRPSAGEINISPRSDKGNSNKASFGKKLSLNKLSDRELELYRRDRIGIVFQFMNLIPSLTALENVGLPLLFTGVSLNEKKKQAELYLQETGMLHRAHHKPGEMSGGEQQRIAIAAALVNNPDIIIGDEPTGELDSSTREEILDLFRTLKNKNPDKTIIIVSHDKAVERIADRVLRIQDGIIVSERKGRTGNFSDLEKSTIENNEIIQQYREVSAQIKQDLRKISSKLDDLDNKR